MAPDGYTNVGEEFIQKTAYRQDLIGSRPASVDILLYSDNDDDLGDGSDIGDVTTEPSTSGSYARQTLSLDSADVSLAHVNGNLEASFSVTFDTTDPTTTVDAWGAVVTFQSDVVNSDGSATDHLLTATRFDSGSEDLSNNDSVTVDGAIALS